MKTTSIVLILLLCGPSYHQAILAYDEPTTQTRHPVAIAVLSDGRRVVAANHASGSISMVNFKDQKVVSEKLVGKKLSDIIPTMDPHRLLLTDEETHELISVRVSPSDFQVEKRLVVSPYPVSVNISNDGTRVFVASLWSKTITVVDLTKWLSESENSSSAIVRQIRLPFSPREQLVVDAEDQRRMSIVPDQPKLKLIVADAFSSKIAVVDPESGQILSVREIPGHAIRGMRMNPAKPRLVMTHQLLNRLGSTTFDDIHWGGLMLNCLRSLDLSDVLDPKSDLLKHSVVEYLGGPEHGAGDPAGFVIKPGGFIGIAISGTDEFLFDEGRNLLFTTRLKTQSTPTAVELSADHSHAFIVNSLSDSITMVELASPKVVATISLGPRPELNAVERGERLFHNAKLSHDKWISCASCHVDGHTNGLLNDNFTDRTFGTAKRVLSLRGVADTAPYAWNGRFPTLAEQITHSIESTMQGKPLTESQAIDLEAYLRSLLPIPAIGSDDKTAIAAGSTLFESLDCHRCHTQPTFTSSQIVDVQLKDERGNNVFNPPSLRGVSQNGPYFHDGRAQNLDEIFTKFQHQLDRELSKDEIHNLITFLHSL